MGHVILMRTECAEHAGDECIVCDGSGHIQQWVPVVRRELLVRVPGKAHSRSQAFLMIGEPTEFGILELLAGPSESP